MADTSSAPSRGTRHPAFAPAVAGLVGLAYAGAHLAWYAGTPLGQFPVVDEQENLVLAESIVRDELPREPFYRAMGYPLLLALLRHTGVDAENLFSAALVLGVIFHGANAALLAKVALSWFGRAAALAAGLLGALHPVLVHYATQALDATPALSCFLAGLAGLAPVLALQRPVPPAAWLWIVASLAWAAATAFRPNYLLVWITLPVLAVWIHHRMNAWRCALAATSGVVLIAVFAGWQNRVSGEVRFLPWQGAYNLWAANEPGSHGRYFVQRVQIPSSVATLNTTRAESIFRYRQDTGAAPADIAALNAHWRQKFLHHIRDNPLTWARLLGTKAYALLNSWEQYNNKTFAFHKARSPWLRWNPLSWGVLLLGAVLGFWRLARELPLAAQSLAIVGGALALGVLLFFVSARFRLPLAALLVVLTGGAVAAPLVWRSWPRRTQIALAVTLLTLSLVTFSSFGEVRDRRTFVEDQALLARAAFAVGDSAQAWQASRATLELQPTHRDALRVAVSAFFNHLVRHGRGPGSEADWLAVCKQLLATRDSDVRDLQAIAALALWRSGDRTGAFGEWLRLGRTPSAIAARLAAGDKSAHPNELAATRAGWDEALVRLVAAHLGLRTPDGQPSGDPHRATEILRILFHSPPPP